MKNSGIIFASAAAIGFMIFYHLIPFLFIGGAPNSIAKLWPFSMAGSIVSVALGFYQVWRQKQSQVPVGRLSECVLWFSAAVVFGLILFSRAIATFWRMYLETDMNRKGIIFGSIAAIAFLIFYHFYGGSTVPSGQQPLIRLNGANIASLKNEFNGSADSVRVLVLLSPT